jgi:hypothetical protein
MQGLFKLKRLGIIGLTDFPVAGGIFEPLRKSGQAVLPCRRAQQTSDEVKELRREASALKEVVAELTLENRLLKKA